MMEVLVEAERALTHGLVDEAERLYRTVADNDPKSSIAVMGLARVALERGDDRGAYLQARAALAIDPENPAAQHLVMRMTEVMAGRGETPPDAAEPTPDAAGPKSAPAPPPAQPSAGAAKAPRSQPKPGLVGRLLGRSRRRR